MQADLILDNLFFTLQRSGRDWQSLDLALTGFRHRLLSGVQGLAGEDEWGSELCQYALHSFSLVIGQAIDIAVAREEFEWAGALARQRAELAAWAQET